MERKDNELLANLKQNLPDLEKLLEKVSSEWGYEDSVYRFYHHSFKVFNLQEHTREIVKTLRKLAPKRTHEDLKYYNYEEFNKDFMQIFYEGTANTFTNHDNDRWLHSTRPIVEAFLHAKFFLEQAVKYGKELEEVPRSLPSGWAAFLYFYNMR